MNNTISTFLVLKDEGRTVARALDSALPVTGQFVIGIDETSSDATEEIVRRYASEHPAIDWEIYKFKWENHFARARNRAIERCRGDWVLQLDGHEYLRSGSAEMVQCYACNTSPDIWLISAMMHLEPDRYGIPEIFFVQHHLWRNGRGIRYVNASHNAIPLDIVPDGRRLRTNDIVIVHQRPADNASSRRIQREEMNIPNFEAALDELPDDPRSLFYMAQSWVDCGRPAEAIPFYRRYLEVSRHHEERYEAAIKLGEIQAIEGDPDGAGESFHLAMRTMPTRAEAPFNLGLLAKARIDGLNSELLDAEGTIADPDARQLYLNRLHALVEEADRWFAIAASTAPPVTSYFLRGRIYTYLPHLERARLAAALYRYTGLETHLARARQCYKRVLDFRPEDPDVLSEMSSLEDHCLSRVAATIPPSADNRPRLLVVDATGQFTPPLVERWREHYDVRTLRSAGLRKDACSSAASGAGPDAVFVEWCDANAVEISRQSLDVRVVCRLWRYEAYSARPRACELAQHRRPRRPRRLPPHLACRPLRDRRADPRRATRHRRRALRLPRAQTGPQRSAGRLPARPQEPRRGRRHRRRQSDPPSHRRALAGRLSRAPLLVEASPPRLCRPRPLPRLAGRRRLLARQRLASTPATSSPPPGPSPSASSSPRRWPRASAPSSSASRAPTSSGPPTSSTTTPPPPLSTLRSPAIQPPVANM